MMSIATWLLKGNKEGEKMKDDLMYEIKALLEQKASVSEVECFVNLEGDRVVTYKQNGEKYLVSVDVL